MGSAMLIRGFKTLMCLVALMAALPAMSGAGDEPPVSLSNQSLSIAIAAREEFMRHGGNDYFNMRIKKIGTRFDVYIEPTSQPGTYIGMRCDNPLHNICGCGCGRCRCFYVAVAADLKVMLSYWDRSAEVEMDNGSNGIIGGMVLPF